MSGAPQLNVAQTLRLMLLLEKRGLKLSADEYAMTRVFEGFLLQDIEDYEEGMAHLIERLRLMDATLRHFWRALDKLAKGTPPPTQEELKKTA